uniref:Uncharacterized protein n=1 Tax=Desulfovibrio sp. U5L TaxID=596152 RepID=I2PZ22_9BACT
MIQSNEVPVADPIVEFRAERHIDKIQLSIKDRCRYDIIARLSSKANRITKYDPLKDRMINAFKSDVLNAEVTEYYAKNGSKPGQKAWCSVRLYDPTEESQALLINDIISSVPKEERFVKCIEFALDLSPYDTKHIHLFHRYIARHLTLKNSQPALVRKAGNSFTFNPQNRDNIQVITYLIPKNEVPQGLRIELRLYREHIARRYPGYALFNSPIQGFVNPLSSSYIIFRNPIIESPFPIKRKEIAQQSILRKRISLGLTLGRVDAVQKEEFVQDQISVFRHLARSLGIKHRDINYYFPKRPDILQQLTLGRLQLKETSPIFSTR